MTKRTIFALVMLAASAQFFAASASAAATETDQWCVPAAAITDDGEISRTVAVPPTTDVRTIVGVRVRVAATHPWVGDLSFRVRHPSGIEVVLVDRPGIPSVGFPGPWGCGGDNIDCWFDDAAVAAAETTCSVTAVPVLAGSLRPTGSLASLKGLAPQGAPLFFEQRKIGSRIAGVLGKRVHCTASPPSAVPPFARIASRQLPKLQPGCASQNRSAWRSALRHSRRAC
jgi:hypothetical protein